MIVFPYSFFEYEYLERVLHELLGPAGYRAPPEPASRLHPMMMALAPPRQSAGTFAGNSHNSHSHF
jgi:hypothetical protein